MVFYLFPSRTLDFLHVCFGKRLISLIDFILQHPFSNFTINLFRLESNDNALMRSPFKSHWLHFTDLMRQFFSMGMSVSLLTALARRKSAQKSGRPSAELTLILPNIWTSMQSGLCFQPPLWVLFEDISGTIGSPFPSLNISLLP